MQVVDVRKFNSIITDYGADFHNRTRGGCHHLNRANSPRSQIYTQHSFSYSLHLSSLFKPESVASTLTARTKNEKKDYSDFHFGELGASGKTTDLKSDIRKRIQTFAYQDRYNQISFKSAACKLIYDRKFMFNWFQVVHIYG